MPSPWSDDGPNLLAEIGSAWDGDEDEFADEYDELAVLRSRIAAVLADLEHVRAKGATTHHDACWDEHIGCLAARIRRTLTGEAVVDGGV